MIIMLIAMLIGFANMYPIVKYTILIAFISFIIYKIKKYKSKPSKEEMARFEAEYEAEYEAKLRENDEIEIPKSVYFAEDDEEFVKEFGKPTLNRKLFENKIIKNVRYAGENYGPTSFKLITKSFDYNGLYYDGIYNENINAYEILNMPEHYDLYDIKYVKYCELLHLVEYEEDTDTLLIY